MIKATNDYANWIKSGVKNTEAKEVNDTTNMLIDMCVSVLRHPKTPKHFFAWIKTRKITRDYLLDNHNLEELNEIIETILEPIIGKKKGVQLQMENAAKDLNKLKPSALQKLLLNLSRSQDGKRMIYSIYQYGKSYFTGKNQDDSTKNVMDSPLNRIPKKNI
jgi:desulfoferrodoxin (superoxide reductase-like protein)